MNENTTNSDVSKVFDSLVNNAIDFFKQSIKEFEYDPKYSIIHFFASIELFFKARLLLEHWSLITDDPRKAKYQNFLQGDFASVGLEEAMSRLEGICGESFDKQEKEIFKQIKDHRNRLMHFYHPKYSKRNSNTLYEVAAEQCKGWYYLYKLLTINWKPKFDTHLERLRRLEILMKKQRSYLNVKFEQLQENINQEQAKGFTFIECPSCSFRAGRLSSEEIGPVIVTCLVCEDRFERFKLICTECNSHSIIDQSHICSNCKKEIQLQDTLYDLNGIIEKWAFCNKCRYHTLPSIAYINNRWFCLSCFTSYEDREINLCGWCKEYVTGETGDYYSPGCFMCGVYIQQESEEELKG
jgi:hypothetical protein